jgi:acetyl esterase/lipase
MSLRMAATALYVRGRYRRRHDLAHMDRMISARSRAAPIPDDVRGRVRVTEHVVAGRPVFELAPRHGSPRAHAIHTHGGAFVFAIQGHHWRVISRLVAASGVAFHVPLYGLAPRADVLAAHSWLGEVHRHVVASAGRSPIVLSGDSAGAALALGQAIRLRDMGRPAPAAVLLFSPWLDLTTPERSDPRLERRDPMLSRRGLHHAATLWARSIDLGDPRVSPILAPVGGLPAVHIFAGGRDLLVEDAARLHEKIRASGGSSTLRVWRSGFHLFFAALSTPEAVEAMDEIVRTLRAIE